MTMPSRPTSSIVQAVPANLEWAHSIALDKAAESEGTACAFHSGRSNALAEAIALVRVEFQGLQEAIPDVSSP
jgi:hypothetical protein